MPTGCPVYIAKSVATLPRPSWRFSSNPSPSRIKPSAKSAKIARRAEIPLPRVECGFLLAKVEPMTMKLIGLGGIARALRSPNYGIYTAGNAISLIGTWMQRVAVGWLTWKLTGSGAWLGAMAFADLFPTVLIGPFAGAVADRWDRLR